jgi:hypothetical protein
MTSSATLAHVESWIDPDNLVIKIDHCICALCFGVMKTPVSGCPEGHSFCLSCLEMEHSHRQKCPVCRFPKKPEVSLVRNRPLEGIISQLCIKCEHGTKVDESQEVCDGPVVKKMKPSPLCDMTTEMLKKELGRHFLMLTGTKAVLVTRLQERIDRDNFLKETCTWVGTIDQLSNHSATCGWVRLQCTTIGCIETPTRRSFAEHVRTCTPIICCPNDGCDSMFQVTNTTKHLEKCLQEKIICPCKECGQELLRGNLAEHVAKMHMTTEGTVLRLRKENAREDAFNSELKFAEYDSGITESSFLSTLVMNWASGHSSGIAVSKRYSDGWGCGPIDGVFRSGSFMFENGGNAQCFLKKTHDNTYNIGVSFVGIGVCKIHMTYTLLRKNDKAQRTIFTVGSDQNPTEHNLANMLSKGASFTTTSTEKEDCRRSDGSVRFRVVIRLFREKTCLN